MLEHLVVVDSLFDEQPFVHEQIDGAARGISTDEERAAIDLANDLALAFNEWVGTDDLQVKDDSVGDQRFSKST
ncbi:MAG: hypothetical protein ACJ757_11330 [Gaiellaceae bacterium]